MPEAILRTALAMFLLASSATAQPPRDTRPATTATTGTASISGTVVVAGSGAPARRARVTLSGIEPRGVLTRVTGDEGRFAFTGIPAGRYSLSASKPGHVTVIYGQHRPGAGRAGTPIQLADGQQFQARLQMPRGGVITGTILDERAEATPGIQIRAMRAVIQRGERTLQSAGSGTTDDRGVYRIFGLQPGEYVVCATPRGSIAVDMERMQVELEALRRKLETVEPADTIAAQDARESATFLKSQDGEAPQQTGFAPVCYPGSGSPAAGAIVLGIGEERMAVDFQLQAVPLARVEGTVVNPSGAPLQNVQVTLAAAGDVALLANRTARADGDGRFRILAVPPGQYTLTARAAVRLSRDATPTPQTAAEKVIAAGQARAASGRVQLWSTLDVAVEGAGLTDVVLSLHPGVSVSGQVAFDGATQPPADLSRVRVTLNPLNPPGVMRGLASAATGRVDAAGRFTIPDVAPGRYRLSASGGGSGWSVESAAMAGQDAADFPLEIRANQNVTGVTITFTDRQTELTGAVVDERNQPVSAYTVVVYAADPRYWVGVSRRIQATRPGTDGRFTFRNLPPGDYRLATLFDPEPGSWYDPAFLQQLEASSTTFSLAAGEKKVQNVRVSSAR